MRAAVVVAVLAAFLAVATFLSNESVKEVITGETKAADANATLETNDVKGLIASGDSTLLRVVGTGSPKEAVAVAKAQALETRIETELVPIEGALRAKIATDDKQRNRADSQHLLYELSETALQIGIVLAGISILARRRLLLAGGGLVGLAGIGAARCRAHLLTLLESRLSSPQRRMPAAGVGILVGRGAAGWPGARHAVRLLYAGARVGYRLRRTGFRRDGLTP